MGKLGQGHRYNDGDCIAMKRIVLGTAFLLTISALPTYAMHIPEGVLPPQWAGLWYVIAIPFILWGLRDLRTRSHGTTSSKPLIGMIGAAVFVISCMPIPVPIAGTCSHPCGTGIAAILIGAPLTVVVTSIALLLQALFLSHGGLTTLGANVVSMGVAGAFTGAIVFRVARHCRVSPVYAAFFAGLFSDWMTYAMTSLELASALHGSGSMLKMFGGIAVAFAPTQIPLGILEGILAAGMYRFIVSRRPELIVQLKEARVSV